MKKIDYTQIEENIKRIKDTNKVCLVLKNDAYGFGLEKVVELAIRQKVDSFAVNQLSEAIRVRKITNLPILMLGTYEGPISELKKYAIIPTAHSLIEAKRYDFHGIYFAVEIDSGMNRFGFKKIEDEVFRFYYLIYIYLHLFQTIDSNKRIIDFYQKKCDTFGIEFHFGGSLSYGNSGYIRIGRLIYKDGLSFFGRVLHLKDVSIGETIGYDAKYKEDKGSRVAILDVGYYNGVPLGFNGFVSKNGILYPVVGKVCMNHCFVLVDEQIKIGDYLEFFGGYISIETYRFFSHQTEYECFLSIR